MSKLWSTRGIQYSKFLDKPWGLAWACHAFKYPIRLGKYSVVSNSSGVGNKRGGIIRYRQIFSGGYHRTKMKIWSDENEKLVGKFFARLWCAKKGFPNFSRAAGFFRRRGTENR